MYITLTETVIKDIGIASIGLSDVGDAQFMRRVDNKYIIPASEALELLTNIKEHYYIVENNGFLIPEYLSEYFDTQEMTMYLDHHNQRGKRYKIRIRQYAASGDTFLEVKLRIPSGETLKKRIELDNPSIHNPVVREFIESKSPYMADTLQKIMITRFNRITLVANGYNERVTMDFNINLQSATKHTSVNLFETCIVESKRNKYSPGSKISEFLKHKGYRSSGFSKYSIGCALLHDDLKKNNFKAIIHQLKKQYHENTLAVDAS